MKRKEQIIQRAQTLQHRLDYLNTLEEHYCDFAKDYYCQGCPCCNDPIVMEQANISEEIDYLLGQL